jgi:hypothetical protein
MPARKVSPRSVRYGKGPDGLSRRLRGVLLVLAVAARLASNAMGLAYPLAQIDEPTAFAAEGTPAGAVVPFDCFSAVGTGDGGHLRISVLGLWVRSMASRAMRERRAQQQLRKKLTSCVTSSGRVSTVPQMRKRIVKRCGLALVSGYSVLCAGSAIRNMWQLELRSMFC